eukprot:TRINITY_DN5151_c0_g1_i2.p1 TRINITY_DN5151_c0_g1~~TRINITY_DN5151_c0_g1_i2.p1  ORF type:complete len:493 (-),score=68.30 TRINITY_DN5151_c0_g1_i2:23-1501(-)
MDPLLDDSRSRTKKSNYLKVVVGVVVLIIVIFLIVFLAVDTLVKVNEIKNHLGEFYNFALNNSNSRSVIHGYKDSAEYVIKQLEDLCNVTTQSFLVPITTEISPPALSLVSPIFVDYQVRVDFNSMRYGGNGSYDITRPVFDVPNLGCNSSDFMGITPGDIALILVPTSGDCALITKAMNAENNGASAVIFYNSQNRNSLLTSRVRSAGWFPNEDYLVTIPVITASYSLGSTLKNVTQPSVHLVSHNEILIVETFNVFCTTSKGDESEIVMAGAHLDSVAEGPGINDNGSGSATLLEIARQWLKSSNSAKNLLKFAWWGGEELGLLGSRHFIRDLQDNNPEELDAIILYLNFDMLASPNYIPQIHDGNSLNITARNGSKVITQVFVDYFTSKDWAYNFTGMAGGSDYLPFNDVGIPAGGLAAGAGGIKTEEQRKLYGGLADAWLDPCYHKPCDNLDNISDECLSIFSQAAAHTIQFFAEKTDLREFLAESNK